MRDKRDFDHDFRRIFAVLVALIAAFCTGCESFHTAPANMFHPAGSPASEIESVTFFMMAVLCGIFVAVGGLLTYVIVKYRTRRGQEKSEPPQIYGSTQIELSWTVVPVLIVVMLFLVTARMIYSIEDAQLPTASVQVTAVGHQFWFEYRYPKYGFVTANELHIPVSDPKNPTPTSMTLLSADVVHTYWVPRLGGKIDMIPNRVNRMWLEPFEAGEYLGQCNQFCGVQHAKMLLTVYADTPEQFDAWIKNQQLPARENQDSVEGRRVFVSTACVNCHTVRGTGAHGLFGPDLTHVMSRKTIASGAVENNVENLRQFIKNPDHFKPGVLMPAMNLNDRELDEVVQYLSTLN